jgi:integrase
MGVTSRAAAVFWFLSGIRVGASVTLPVAAIDLGALTVKQWPSLGVHTKFGKHATTHLLNIPELLEIVQEWDSEVRSMLPDSDYWFAPLLPDTDSIDTTADTVGEHRTARARKDLREWFRRVNLRYHSPHKFRHGNAVYSLKQCQDVADFKAVSQNLMHSNLSITDGVYGMLSEGDVGQRIAHLGQSAASSNLLKLEASVRRILRDIEAAKFH